MATHSVGAGNYIRPYRRVRIAHFPEGANQSFRIGDPLILDTTANKGNQVVLAGTDPATGTVVGFAAEAASGTEGTPIAVWVLDGQGEFLVYVENGETLDNDAVGDEYGIVFDSTNNIYRLDQDETTSKVFRVLGLAPGHAHGDTNGAYICKSAATGQAVYRP